VDGFELGAKFAPVFLYETPPSKKGIVSRWFMAFCPTTLSLPLQVEGIKSIKLLSLLGKN
jgi:hypothetical protein